MKKIYEFIKIIPWLICYILFRVIDMLYVVLIPSIILNNMVMSSSITEFIHKSYAIFLIEFLLAIAFNLSQIKKDFSLYLIRVKNMNEAYMLLTRIDYKLIFKQETLDKIERLNFYTISDAGFQNLINKLLEAIISIIILILIALRFESINILWLIGILALLVIEIVFSTYLSRGVNKTYKQMQSYQRQMEYYANMMSVYDNHQTLEINGYIDLVIENYETAFQQSYKLQKKQLIYNTLNSILAVVSKYGLLAVLLIYFLTNLGLNGVAEIWLLVNVATMFSGLMENLLSFIFQVTVDREVYNINSEIKEFDDFEYSEREKILISKVEFINVGFKYENEWILKDCNLILEEGKKYALIGRNGCGKTTIINLLLGFFEVTEGQILINDKPFESYDINVIRASVSCVFQENNIYPATLNDNILMKSGGDKLEFNQQIKRKFSILEKYDLNAELTKYISESGIRPSGGEESQIALLRALVKNSGMYILDEPNSSLDVVNEKKLYKMFDDVFANKFFLLTTHRMEACKYVDRILFLDDGKIVEQGSHSQLIVKQKGAYANFCELQNNIYLGGSDNE